MDMAMLPQSSVGQMGREIQTRPPAERQPIVACVHNS